ncbi:CTAG/Pcc1 family [Radiomyces spectabilis]|uniref:CTAG/Pcc1 family n=1 Tax=Radiomyces spectabilis TaxID=64574 RepID=UPI002220CB2F|nr:CTAG/Pcc1 family [Radiomyces spectabilis]KAI8369351.1 CTAG/Pcc1 family [Radiomyces spectabilis]
MLFQRSAPFKFSMSHTLQLEIPFESDRLANVAMRVLSVDKELKTDQVKRTLSTNEEMLIAHFDCVSTKMLRVSVNSFLEMLTMVTRTVDQFDP